jgi:hypothetical protein
MAGDKTMAPTTSDIAFATMVGDEPVFLPIWINYYARFVPKSQLFIVVDGLNRAIPPEAEGWPIRRRAVICWTISRGQAILG